MADFDGQILAVSLVASQATPDPVPAQAIFDLVVAAGPIGGASPQIGNFVPAPGTPIDRNQLIRFDVTDDTGLLRAEVFVKLGGDTFVVHDGETFRGRFTNFSSRAPIAGGFRYNVRPNGGWLDAPTFEVHAVDTTGQEAT